MGKWWIKMLEKVFNKPPSIKKSKDRLIANGLNNIFGQGYNICADTKKIRNAVISYPEILSDHFESINNTITLTQVFDTANEQEVDLYKNPFWKKKIDKIAGQSSETLLSIWSGHADHIISAAKMVPGFDWLKLFKGLSERQDSNNYIRPSYRAVVKSLAAASPDKFKTHVETSIFFAKKNRPTYAVRGLMYSEYIKAGLLTKKTARKIRSDGSEDSSVTGLRSLVDNIDLYSNSDELLLQFTDSKYEAVICYLADQLPEYLLTSIMGTEFYWAKRKIENRLESIEKEREASRKAKEMAEEAGV
jgi:hypothetical protein